MKIIYDKPRTGKTTELIKRCAENGGYIVCINENSRDDIMEKEMKVKIPYPLTFGEFLGGRYYPQGVKRVYIDNADMLIKTIAKGVDVDSIVMDNLEDCYLEENKQSREKEVERC